MTKPHSDDSEKQKVKQTTKKTVVLQIDSDELLKGNREVIINHHGEIYRLHLTKNDKLILHK